MSYARNVIVCLSLFLFYKCSDSATSTSFGDIQGQVNLIAVFTDGSGDPVTPVNNLIIDNIEVKLFRSDAPIGWTLTNDFKQYNFFNIETGTYTVKAFILDELITSNMSVPFEVKDFATAPFLNIPNIGDLNNDDFSMYMAIITDSTGPDIIYYGIAVSLENRTGTVKLLIYNSNNNLVRSLVNEDKEIGNFLQPWDFKGDNGLMLPAGEYYVLGIFTASNSENSIIQVMFFSIPLFK